MPGHVISMSEEGEIFPGAVDQDLEGYAAKDLS